MAIFSDILYGEIEIPDWFEPFIKIPEFSRLRGVRLSNVDSYQFKDFSPNRWEHSIAVVHLAIACAETARLSMKSKLHLMLAALYHDIATPPFGHTVENILPGFDHELESQHLLASPPSHPVYMGQFPQFDSACKSFRIKHKIEIDPERVGRIIVGDDEELGHIIHGSVDLDNADNVTRACHYLGIKTDPAVPIEIAKWLSKQKKCVLDIESVDNAHVQEWLKYKNCLYSHFFTANDSEIGRQAFLEHIIRRAIGEGLSENALIWNTDEFLLYFLMKEGRQSKNDISQESIKQLVERYCLLEEPTLLAKIPLESIEQAKLLRTPQAVLWMSEEYFRHDKIETFIHVSQRRTKTVAVNKLAEPLFPEPWGYFYLFKLGGAIDYKHFSEWIYQSARKDDNLRPTPAALSNAISKKIHEWTNGTTPPWITYSPKRENMILKNLRRIEDWSFRLSQNENIHRYPGTFVHTIPATMINVLGLGKQVILDPFGGTGQTAVEAALTGSTVISSDSNSIATLATKVKLTFLDAGTRQFISKIDENKLLKRASRVPKSVENAEKWFHPQTLDELGRIFKFICDQKDEKIKDFLKLCFSNSLTSCTERRGKEYAYFADNTPLPRNLTKPSYQNAVTQFLANVKKNLQVIERLYGQFERHNLDAKKCFEKVRVIQADARELSPKLLGIKKNSVAGIITSPPYLCMVDYTLGHRLSYMWLFPKVLKEDFDSEIGARRSRSSSISQIESSYFDGLEKFISCTPQILMHGGYFVTVLGEPQAKKFHDKCIINQYDTIMEKYGLKKLWDTDREIQWHRNHTHARLRHERISVHVFE